MAKGQKRSNKEIKKPKKDAKAKPVMQSSMGSMTKPMSGMPKTGH